MLILDLSLNVCADAQHVILVEPVLDVAVEAQSIGKTFTVTSVLTMSVVYSQVYRAV